MIFFFINIDTLQIIKNCIWNKKAIIGFSLDEMMIAMIIMITYAADAAHAALPITYDIFFYYKLNELKYYLKQIFIKE